MSLFLLLCSVWASGLFRTKQPITATAAADMTQVLWHVQRSHRNTGVLASLLAAVSNPVDVQHEPSVETSSEAATLPVATLGAQLCPAIVALLQSGLQGKKRRQRTQPARTSLLCTALYAHAESFALPLAFMPALMAVTRTGILDA